MKTLKPNIWKRVLAEKDWGKRFNLLLTEANYNKDMTEKEVRALLKKNTVKWTDFKRWMYGQTRPVLENGEGGFYQHDVERYIRHKTKGEALIWD